MLLIDCRGNVENTQKNEAEAARQQRVKGKLPFPIFRERSSAWQRAKGPQAQGMAFVHVLVWRTGVC